MKMAAGGRKSTGGKIGVWRSIGLTSVLFCMWLLMVSYGIHTHLEDMCK